MSIKLSWTYPEWLDAISVVVETEVVVVTDVSAVVVTDVVAVVVVILTLVPLSVTVTVLVGNAVLKISVEADGGGRAQAFVAVYSLLLPSPSILTGEEALTIKNRQYCCTNGEYSQQDGEDECFDPQPNLLLP